jgi:LytR cell envelope-related transcriptional attenuator
MTAASSSHRSTPSAAAPSIRVPLVVVNSTGRLGLAAAAADTFRAGGWTVSLLANYAGPVATSCAYYDPAVPHAQDAALGLQRQFPAIRRVAARFDPLPAGPVVVVLADDYAASPSAGPSAGQRDTGAMR